MHFLEEHHIFVFLLQLLILMGCARGAGSLLRRVNQPSLPGEMLVGLLLGPTLLGRFLPDFQQALFPADAIQWAMLDTVAWLGVLLLLLDTGLEVDFSIAWRRRGSALMIAIADILIPIFLVFAVFIWMPDRYFVDPGQRWLVALFIGTVLTISELPATARVLNDLRLLKSDMGYLILSALTANDLIGWVLFTIMLGVFTSGVVAFGPIAIVFAGTIAFAVLALTLGRRVSSTLFAHLKTKKVPEPGTSLTITVLLGLLFGSITQWMGIHALFGFFIAGIVVGEAKAVSEQTRGIISQLVHSLFVPVFFATIGLKIDFVGEFDWLAVSVICVAGIGGRYIGAWLGVTWSSVPRMNRDLISIAHTPGGIMQIVIAILAKESGIITDSVFVSIIFGAILSTMLMGPWMKRSFARRMAVKPGDFLCAAAIIPHLQSTDRPGAIRELSLALAQAGGIQNQDHVLATIMTRETDYGTALGSGIAIPHARIETVKNPVIAFGRSESGIEWDAPDGRPVRYIFMLATPIGVEDVHVQILALIARNMANPESEKRLQGAVNANQIENLLRSDILVTDRCAENRSR
jgi:Kef-type K+ transport system membrane component KefB/mannitol/fructose-specific phosphotransferase system IIA component (Ntr-type)